MYSYNILYLHSASLTLSHAVDYAHFPGSIPQVNGYEVLGVAHLSADPERQGCYHGDRGGLYSIRNGALFRLVRRKKHPAWTWQRGEGVRV